MDVWKITTIAFAALFVAALGINMMTGMASQPLAEETGVKEKVINYVETKFGLSATVDKMTDKGSFYEMTMAITSSDGKTQSTTVYASKDGKFMFVSDPFDLNERVTKAPEAQKLEKPQAELFIMAFCPYGALAQTNMKPVADLLGDKADVKVRFIVSTSGNQINSLHGPLEAAEDMRQICIRENYNQKTYWDYAYQVASYYNAESEACWKETDQSKMAACLNAIYSTVDTTKWKEFAGNAGIDAAKIESCVSTDAITLLKADEALSNKYGVTASPTLILNGASVSAGGSPQGYLTGICGGFTAEPAECSQKLNDTQNAGSGKCN